MSDALRVIGSVQVVGLVRAIFHFVYFLKLKLNFDQILACYSFVFLLATSASIFKSVKCGRFAFDSGVRRDGSEETGTISDGSALGISTTGIDL